MGWYRMILTRIVAFEDINKMQYYKQHAIRYERNGFQIRCKNMTQTHTHTQTKAKVCRCRFNEAINSGRLLVLYAKPSTHETQREVEKKMLFKFSKEGNWMWVTSDNIMANYAHSCQLNKLRNRNASAKCRYTKHQAQKHKTHSHTPAALHLVWWC